MAGETRDAPLRWHPVHPARRPNDCRGQVSWLPDRYRAPPSRFPSGVVERDSPVTVAGAARDSRPASLDRLAPIGPASRAIRDVERPLNAARDLVQLWHDAIAADAAHRAR